jgi:hypothetical protein
VSKWCRNIGGGGGRRDFHALMSWVFLWQRVEVSSFLNLTNKFENYSQIVRNAEFAFRFSITSCRISTYLVPYFLRAEYNDEAPPPEAEAAFEKEEKEDKKKKKKGKKDAEEVG